jgi:23S rRNA pseudouridine1911/1915/1917 synthase
MPASLPVVFVADDLSQPTRLDRTLRARFPEWGRQVVQRTIGAGSVRVNGKTVRLASWEVRRGDTVEVLEPPPAKPAPAQAFEDGWLLADDGDILAVHKPAGLLAEPTRWGQGANLRDLAAARFGEVILFHRLDRDTSGVVLLTRPGPVNAALSAAFQSRKVVKEYMAVVAAPNRLETEGVIRLRLAQHPQRRDMMAVIEPGERGGQHAATRYAVEASAPGRQLVRLWPETGRTHQLRVHLAALGAPILGDRLYSAESAPRLLLHACSITLPPDAPLGGRSYAAPLPPEIAI